jgi:hypothetical protein
MSKNKKIGSRSNTNKILEVLHSSEPNGLTTSELREKTGLHRDTISYICSKLIKGGEIIKFGKKGKYHLTTSSAKNPQLQYRTFGMESVRNLSSWLSSNFPPTEDRFIFNLRQKEYVFFECLYKKENLSKESETLLYFAIQIGILMTFIMLKAIEPSDEQDGEIKKNNTMLWINNTIIPNTILSQFMELDVIKKGKMKKKSRVGSITKNITSTTPDFIKEESMSKLISDFSYSPYEINEKTYLKLEKEFKNIWPFSYFVLENIQEKLSEIIEKGIGSIPENIKAVENIKRKLKDEP